MRHFVTVRRFTDGENMFGPPVSDKFLNALGHGSRLILTTGPDPGLERAICHLVANGHTAGVRPFKRRPVCHYEARLAWPRTMAFALSLKNGQSPALRWAQSIFQNALSHRLVFAYRRAVEWAVSIKKIHGASF
jgi:hypothetical protein